MCCITHGDLAFRHRFEQGGLNFSGGPVNLISENNIVEQRAGFEVELAAVGLPYLGAGQVGRQQIRGELNALEIPFYQAGKLIDGAGFCQAGRALNQQVAIAQQCNKQSIKQVFLANDLPGHLLPGQ